MASNLNFSLSSFPRDSVDLWLGLVHQSKWINWWGRRKYKLASMKGTVDLLREKSFDVSLIPQRSVLFWSSSGLWCCWRWKFFDTVSEDSLFVEHTLHKLIRVIFPCQPLEPYTCRHHLNRGCWWLTCEVLIKVKMKVVQCGCNAGRQVKNGMQNQSMPPRSSQFLI